MIFPSHPSCSPLPPLSHPADPLHALLSPEIHPPSPPLLPIFFFLGCAEFFLVLCSACLFLILESGGHKHRSPVHHPRIQYHGTPFFSAAFVHRAIGACLIHSIGACRIQALVGCRPPNRSWRHELRKELPTQQLSPGLRRTPLGPGPRTLRVSPKTSRFGSCPSCCLARAPAKKQLPLSEDRFHTGVAQHSRRSRWCVVRIRNNP